MGIEKVKDCRDFTSDLLSGCVRVLCVCLCMSVGIRLIMSEILNLQDLMTYYIPIIGKPPMET